MAFGWGLWIILSLLAKVSATAGLWDYMLYFNLPYRLPEFALGMGFAMAWKARAALPEATETGVPASWRLGFLTMAYFGLPLSILLKASLPATLAHILLTATCIGIAGSLFASPLLMRLGAKPAIATAAAASYSFYLLHQPILGYGADLLRGHMTPFAAMLLVTVISLPLSYWLARLLDRLVAALLARGRQDRTA